MYIIYVDFFIYIYILEYICFGVSFQPKVTTMGVEQSTERCRAVGTGHTKCKWLHQSEGPVSTPTVLYEDVQP